MMIGGKMIDYLYHNHIRFKVIEHPMTFTAQGTAHSAHVPGKNFAKTVVLEINGKMNMMVMPAEYKVNLSFLKNIFWTDDVKLASEEELKGLFPDCEIGGMPPFGNLYGIDVFVSEELTKDDEIAFNAGNHTELVKMTYSDYAKLVHPNVLDFTII